MKISGFTIIKNAILNDYPVVEAIESVLPVVDEMVVLVGDCQDETEALIRKIPSEKIKIFHSVWDANLRSGGTVLAVETDKAFRLIDPESTWAFYIQSDEVVHEKYHAIIREACKAWQGNTQVEGLLFKYLHFLGTYDYIGDSRKWYSREVRIIRNDKRIQSYKDAQGFRIGSEKLKVKEIDAYIYHYGWVKSPEQMLKKQKNSIVYWYSDEEIAAWLATNDAFDLTQFDSVQKFRGTHPAVMQQRIAAKNWHLELNTRKKQFSFKNRLLYAFEKLTGWRPFEYKNYRKI